MAHQRLRTGDLMLEPRAAPEAVRRGSPPHPPRGCAQRRARQRRPRSAHPRAWIEGLPLELGVDGIVVHHVGQRSGALHRGVRRARPPGARRVRSKATSDLWWKNTVIYCSDVETFLDGAATGSATSPGMTEPDRLPRRDWHPPASGDAVLPLAESRRRLRHQRLLQCPPGLRHAPEISSSSCGRPKIAGCA